MKTIIKVFSLVLLATVLAHFSWATQHTVTVTNFSFSPANLTIQHGDTVVWNCTSGFHSVHHLGNPSRFGTGAASAPWTYSFAFSSIGDSTFHYECEIHPTQMQGTITVQGGTPTLTITSPNGGENWVVGETHPITWTSSGAIVNVDIAINRSFPSFPWETLLTNVPNSGQAQWLVTDPTSENCRIRIRSSADTTILSFSDAPFTISAPPTPEITVTSPNGGEVWQIGSTQSIAWESNNVAGTVDIDIRRASPDLPWVSLFSHVANSGLIPWTVTGPASTTCVIRVRSTSDTTVADVSNGVFTIPVPVITLTSPNGGEVWTTGETHNITWTKENVQDTTVLIELNRNYPGGAWDTLAAAAPDAGIHAWQIAGAASMNCRIRITSNQLAIGDTSNADFEITTPSAVGDPGSDLPKQFSLYQNYPNPFNPSTEIAFDLPTSSFVQLRVFDAQGREVATLINSNRGAGSYHVVWGGSKMSSGIYFYQINTPGFSATKKMMLIK